MEYFYIKLPTRESQICEKLESKEQIWIHCTTLIFYSGNETRIHLNLKHTPTLLLCDMQNTQHTI